MMKKLVFIFVVFPSFAATCPAGMVAVEYDTFMPAVSGACSAGYVAHDTETICGAGDGVCWLVRMGCGAGVSSLRTSTGLSVPLYAEKETFPSLCVRYNNTTCYVDLEPGQASDAINIKYNGVVYHTVE